MAHRVDLEQLHRMLALIPILILLLFQTASAVTYEDFGFSLSTLSLLSGPDMDEEFHLGESATFRFEFTTNNPIQDIVTIDFGAYYNGYSALIFCGEPEVEYTEGEVTVAWETIDESISPSHDTMKLNFGDVDWPAQTTFSITFSVMLINHEKYKDGEADCCYWFGAGVEYNRGMANWVTDIAFSLAKRNTETSETLVFKDDEEAKLIIYGGAGSRIVNLVMPLSTTPSLIVTARINPTLGFTDPGEEKICLCDFSVIAATKSFYGCGDVVLPLFDKINNPPFNESECITEIKLDFGPMAKLGVSGPNDNLDFLLVYRSTDKLTIPATTSELFEFFAHQFDTEKAYIKSGDTNMEEPAGSSDDIDVLTLSFDYDGPSVGSVLAASMDIKPMATSKNAVPKIRLELEYTGSILTDLQFDIVLTEKGSCCKPMNKIFTIKDEDYRTKTAIVEISPVTFVYGPESSFKVSIYGTVATVFVAENFVARAYIYDKVDIKPDLCSSCELSRQISSTDLPEYDPNYFPAIQIGVIDEKTGRVESYVPCFVSGIGIVNMVMTMAADAPANTIEGLTVAFALDELGISVLELLKVSLVHVGDNYPSLKDKRDSDFPIDYTLATKNVSSLNVSYTSFEIYLGDIVSYLPLNTKDVKDRQIIVSLFFSLPVMVSSTWVEPIIGVVSMEEYEETAITALVVAEIIEQTEEVITSFGNLHTLKETFDGDIFRVISWPQNDVVKSSSALEFKSEIAPHEEKVFIVKLYLPPAYSYNEYSLGFSCTPDPTGSIPIFGESTNPTEPVISDLHRATGRNVAFLVDEDTQMYKYAVKDAFVNETKDDYELSIVLNVLGPSTDSSAAVTDLTIACTFTFNYTEEEVGVVTLIVEKPSVNHEYDHLQDLTDRKFSISRNSADDNNFNPPPVPGGSFTRWLDVYIPPQTLTKYELALNLTDFSTSDEMVGLYRMDVISAGKYIGKSFNRSAVTETNKVFTNFSTVDYTSYLLYDLGFITNMYSEIDDDKDHADSGDVVKIAVTFYMGQEMKVGEHFNLTATLYQVKTDTDERKKLTAYKERFEVSDCHLEGLSIYARTKRSTESVITAYPSAYSSDDYAIPITIQLPPDFNGDPTLHIYSPKIDNTGSFLTVRGIELNAEVSVGPDLNASFLDNDGIPETTYIATERTRPDEESSVTIRIGRFTSLDTRQRMGLYNEKDTKEIAAERSFEIVVYVKVQDEDSMADADQVVNMYWAIESKNVLVMAGYNFEVKFHANRRPILQVKSSLSFMIDREFEPGDDIQFTVNASHACDSKATAENVLLYVYKPVLVSEIKMNNSNFLSQKPAFTPPDTGDDYGIFVIQSLRMTEFVEWHYIITVTTDTTYVSEVKSYLLSQIVQPQYGRNARASDSDYGNKIYYLRSATAEAKFIVKNATCSSMVIALNDESRFHSCQITASSTYDDQVYPIKSALNAKNSKGWRSSTWHGQWEGRQYLKVALLEKYKLSRIEFNEITSFSVFQLQYSSDPEGIFWTTYAEQGAPREFRFSESFPADGKPGLRYFDIRLPLIAKWFQLVFTEIDEDNDLGKEKIVDFRFSIYGCYMFDPDDPGDITRACKTGAVIPESYFRGFVTDPDKEVLYVCEKDLKSNLNRCQMMTKGETANGIRYQWSALDSRVQSVIGYRSTSEYTAVFAVAQSQKTYLGSDDGGRSWVTIQTREVWDAQKLSRDSYKPAIVIPFNFPSKDVKEVSETFQDHWLNATFTANQDGIWITEPLDSDQFFLVYSWSTCCP